VLLLRDQSCSKPHTLCGHGGWSSGRRSWAAALTGSWANPYFISLVTFPKDSGDAEFECGDLVVMASCSSSSRGRGCSPSRASSAGSSRLAPLHLEHARGSSASSQPRARGDDSACLDLQRRREDQGRGGA
jgi:hypothetical protein